MSGIASGPPPRGWPDSASVPQRPPSSSLPSLVALSSTSRGSYSYADASSFALSGRELVYLLFPFASGGGHLAGQLPVSVQAASFPYLGATVAVLAAGSGAVRPPRALDPVVAGGVESRSPSPPSRRSCRPWATSSTCCRPSPGSASGTGTGSCPSSSPCCWPPRPCAGCGWARSRIVGRPCGGSAWRRSATSGWPPCSWSGRSSTTPAWPVCCSPPCWSPPSPPAADRRPPGATAGRGARGGGPGGARPGGADRPQPAPHERADGAVRRRPPIELPPPGSWPTRRAGSPATSPSASSRTTPPRSPPGPPLTGLSGARSVNGYDSLAPQRWLDALGMDFYGRIVGTDDACDPTRPGRPRRSTCSGCRRSSPRRAPPRPTAWPRSARCTRSPTPIACAWTGRRLDPRPGPRRATRSPAAPEAISSAAPSTCPCPPPAPGWCGPDGRLEVSIDAPEAPAPGGERGLRRRLDGHRRRRGPPRHRPLRRPARRGGARRPPRRALLVPSRGVVPGVAGSIVGLLAAAALAVGRRRGSTDAETAPEAPRTRWWAVRTLDRSGASVYGHPQLRRPGPSCGSEVGIAWLVPPRIARCRGVDCRPSEMVDRRDAPRHRLPRVINHLLRSRPCPPCPPFGIATRSRTSTKPSRCRTSSPSSASRSTGSSTRAWRTRSATSRPIKDFTETLQLELEFDPNDEDLRPTAQVHGGGVQGAGHDLLRPDLRAGPVHQRQHR